MGQDKVACSLFKIEKHCGLTTTHRMIVDVDEWLCGYLENVVIQLACLAMLKICM